MHEQICSLSVLQRPLSRLRFLYFALILRYSVNMPQGLKPNQISAYGVAWGNNFQRRLRHNIAVRFEFKIFMSSWNVRRCNDVLSQIAKIRFYQINQINQIFVFSGCPQQVLFIVHCSEPFQVSTCIAIGQVLTPLVTMADHEQWSF